MGLYSGLVVLYQLVVGCQNNWIQVVGSGACFA